MIEIRTITLEQTKIYKLICNPVTGKAEEAVICAISTDYKALVNWYLEQLADEPYRDDRYLKRFKKGSQLEWYNPSILTLNETSIFGHGISDEWVDSEILQEVIARGQYFFVE